MTYTAVIRWDALTKFGPKLFGFTCVHDFGFIVQVDIIHKSELQCRSAIGFKPYFCCAVVGSHVSLALLVFFVWL